MLVFTAGPFPLMPVKFKPKISPGDTGYTIISWINILLFIWIILPTTGSCGLVCSLMQAKQRVDDLFECFRWLHLSAVAETVVSYSELKKNQKQNSGLWKMLYLCAIWCWKASFWLVYQRWFAYNIASVAHGNKAGSILMVDMVHQLP